MEHYNGDVEAFLIDLGDATKITAVISENFNAVELLGLRELIVNRDLKRIGGYERIWRERHGEPVIPDFVHQARGAGSSKYSLHVQPTRSVGVPISTETKGGG